MHTLFEKVMNDIMLETISIDMEGCEISIEESFRMVEFIQSSLLEFRESFLHHNLDAKAEVRFFKEMKPEILSMLLYFNKVYTIELKRPNGSNINQKTYYDKELNSLTFFFDRNLDFYQYYRSKSTHLDESYFLRGKPNIRLCVDSSIFISDPEFSTGYDYKVAKILSNEMLRIYLNKKLQYLDKTTGHMSNPSNRNKNRWTGSKSALIEMGYGIYAAKVVDNGNADIRKIMMGLQILFGIELGDYYRTYIAIKSRKKDRTAFLKHLADSLEKRMDEDFDI